MRLDKYLKVSRIFKRRTIAKEVSKNQRVEINHKIAKPASPVQVGDILSIYYGMKMIEVRILAVEEHIKKADALSMYEVIQEQELTNVHKN